MAPRITADAIRRSIANGGQRNEAGRDLTFQNGRITPVNGPGGRAPGRAPGTVPFDPALSAFMRQMGAEEASIRQQARMEVQQAQGQWDLAAPAWDQRIEDQDSAVRMDAEERGLYRSGATVTGLTRGRMAIESERAAARAGLMDQQAASQWAAQNRIAQLRRDIIEQELAARTRIGERRAVSRYGAK